MYGQAPAGPSRWGAFCLCGAHSVLQAATTIQAMYRGVLAREYVTYWRPTLEAERRVLWLRIERFDIEEAAMRARGGHELVEGMLREEIAGLFEKELFDVMRASQLSWLQRAETLERRDLAVTEREKFAVCMANGLQVLCDLGWSSIGAGELGAGVG